MFRILSSRFIVGYAALAAVIGLPILAWRWVDQPDFANTRKVATQSIKLNRDEPPWRYGHIDARFTLVEYADLECPYCRTYFPVLKRWIDANPEVNWQWRHFPLAMHDPAATKEARLAECAGLTSGPPAFWNAVAWIYQQTRGDGQGLPPHAEFPGATPALRQCLAGTRPDVAIRAQIEDAERISITATPTLRVIDNMDGKSLLLPGAVEGDALLSAIDLLASAADQAPLSRASP